MTSIVDKYYRRIIQNIDNVKMKFDISALLVKSKEHDSKIETNESNIANNLNKINTNEKISDKVFNDKYDIENQSFSFNENTHLFKLFEKVIENNFNVELIINNSIYYQYDDLENDLNRLTHLYQIYNKDKLFYSITLDNHDFGKVSNSDRNILNVSDSFCFNIDNKDEIEIVLSLTRINEWGTGLINLQMIDENSINITYNETTNINNKFDKNDKKINTNKTNIGSNKTNIDNNTSLIDVNKTNIGSNKTNIDNNTSLIDVNKTNIGSNKTNIDNNTSLIDVNKTNIGSNKTNIDNNTSLIDVNKTNIESNKTNIDNNTSLIDVNKTNIGSNKTNIDNNTSLIDVNKTNIGSNLNTLNNIDNDLVNLRSIVNNHQNDIQSINGKIFKLDGSYKLKDIIIIDIVKSQIAEIIDSNNEFVIINSSLNNLKKDSYIQFDSSISIFFHKHYINIAFFHILLEYFNENDILIDSIRMPIIGMISRHANITNSCIIKVPNNFDKIYYKLSIKLNEGQNRSDNVSILDFDNKIYFKYFEKIVY